MSENVPLISLLVTETLFDGTQDVVSEIPLDARISSNYRFSAEITEFPIESGATTSDHVHLRPDEITVEGMVSDAHINVVPTVLGLRGDNEAQPPGTRRQTAFDALFKAWQTSVPLTVVTEYLIFDDMVIQSFDVPKSPDRGEAVWFNLSLKKISTVGTLTGNLPPEVVDRLKRRRKKSIAAENANSKVRTYRSQQALDKKLGKVSPTTASDAAQSAAKAAVQAAGG